MPQKFHYFEWNCWLKNNSKYNKKIRTISDLKLNVFYSLYISVFCLIILNFIFCCFLFHLFVVFFCVFLLFNQYQYHIAHGICHQIHANFFCGFVLFRSDRIPPFRAKYVFTFVNSKNSVMYRYAYKIKVQAAMSVSIAVWNRKKNSLRHT